MCSHPQAVSSNPPGSFTHVQLAVKFRPFRNLPQHHATNGHLLDMVMAWNIELGVTIDWVSLPETNWKKMLWKIGLGPQKANSFWHQASIFRGENGASIPVSDSGASPSDMVQEPEFFFVFFAVLWWPLLQAWGMLGVTYSLDWIHWAGPGVVRGWGWRCYEMLTDGNHKSKFRFRCGDCGLFLGGVLFVVLFVWCLKIPRPFRRHFFGTFRIRKSPNGHRQHILNSDVLSNNPSGVVWRIRIGEHFHSGPNIFNRNTVEDVSFP